ncbi:MAG: phage portal protein, partial [Phycisphaerales bacterium]|nr:phage portal protein [Phycisphaerales bacterium]
PRTRGHAMHTATSQASAAQSGGMKNLERIGLSRALLNSVIDRHQRDAAPRLEMLWDYYRNPMQPATPVLGSGGLGQRGLRLAQERGLPSRLAGAWQTRGAAARIVDRADWSRKEIVIENDIAWRINTMVDFMFGRPVRISSTARNRATARAVELALGAVWESSGGVGLMLDIGLLGHVFGSVDLIVKAAGSLAQQSGEAEGVEERGGTEALAASPAPAGEAAASDARDESMDAQGRPHTAGDPSATPQRVEESARVSPAGAWEGADLAARHVRIEVVDPRCGVAIPLDTEHRSIRAYVIRTQRPTDEVTTEARVAPAIACALRRWWRGEAPVDATTHTRRKAAVFTEVYAAGRRQLYRAGESGEPILIDNAPALVEVREGDATPVVHIQNLAQPFEFDGLGEVEPLIPLQDELNIRLSDRASRVTMQSFRMFLAKGIDGAGTLPIAPGLIWSTDNAEASIQAFGGDADAPSEERHIQEVREAMDKASGVPPVAGGVVQAKVGNLSSENALRITLIGLIGKTERKRITYGRGIAEASRLVLDALDRLGILKTDPTDRGVKVDWLDPLPRDENESLTAAERKIALGVPRERVLAELGYGIGDQGVV